MREAPHDFESEKIVLTTLMQPGNEGRAATVLAKLTEDDFMHDPYKLAFRALKFNIQAGVESSVDTMRVRMEQEGTLSRCGGYGWLTELAFGMEVGNPETFADVLIAKRRRRQLMKLGNEIADKAASEEVTPEEIIHIAQSDIRSISEAGRTIRSSSAMDILQKMASFDPLRSGANLVTGYWGIRTLDDLAPIPSGEYTVIGARPGVGKSTLMAQVACQTAVKGVTVLIVTMEVPREDLEARVAAHLTRVPLGRLRAGTYSPEDVAKLGKHGDALSRIRYIDPSAGTPWNELEAMIRYEIQKNNVGLVLLDQFDKVGRPPIAKGSSEAYAFGAVSQGIMAMTKECRIGFVLLCQLKADAEGKEPNLSSHADSDRPGKDGGCVVHMWRSGDQTKVKILKNRNGAGVDRVITLNFDGATQTLTEAERSTPPDPDPSTTAPSRRI